MHNSEEEEVNIILGDALLALFEEDADISAQALSAQLTRMLENETDDARRQVIRTAIRETESFSGSESTADGDTAGNMPLPDQAHPSTGKNH